jgi:hypothetical protein
LIVFASAATNIARAILGLGFFRRKLVSTPAFLTVCETKHRLVQHNADELAIALRLKLGRAVILKWKPRLEAPDIYHGVCAKSNRGCGDEDDRGRGRGRVVSGHAGQQSGSRR